MHIGKAVRIFAFIGIVVGATVWMVFSKNRSPQIACKGCNIVLIALDPLRADELSSYGNPRPVTPTLDSLAKKGFLFTQVFAVSPWTLPSAMSLLTGTYPFQHHITNKEIILKGQKQELVPAQLSSAAPNLTTLATNLKAHGYATGGFAGGAALSPSYGFDQGFDVYKSQGTFDGLPEVLPAARDFIRTHSGEKFFVFIHGFDVHGQYVPLGGYDRRFVENYKGGLTGSAEEQKLLREEGVSNGRIFLTQEDTVFLRNIYDEKMARADESIRSIISDIEDLKLSEKTLIVFTSNHGDEFYEHGRIDHGMTLFDEVLHIPLIIVVPGVIGNKKITSQVRNIDIIPTLFALVGIEPEKNFASQQSGINVLSAFYGKDLRLDVFAETDYRYATFQRAIRTWDNWKLISDEETQSKQLYNLTNDPKELTDLFGQGEKKESELMDELFTYSALRAK